jgi:hypothetical protein
MTILSPSNVDTQPEALVRPEDPNTQTTSLEEAINCVSRSMATTTNEFEDLTSWLLHQGEIKLENRHKSICVGKTPMGRQDNNHTSILRSCQISSQSRWDVPHWELHHERLQEPHSYDKELCKPYYPQNCRSQSHPDQSYCHWPTHTGY